jgi:hypothetical protein
VLVPLVVPVVVLVPEELVPEEELPEDEEPEEEEPLEDPEEEDPEEEEEEPVEMVWLPSVPPEYPAEARTDSAPWWAAAIPAVSPAALAAL